MAPAGAATPTPRAGVGSVRHAAPGSIRRAAVPAVAVAVLVGAAALASGAGLVGGTSGAKGGPGHFPTALVEVLLAIGAVGGAFVLLGALAERRGNPELRASRRRGPRWAALAPFLLLVVMAALLELAPRRKRPRAVSLGIGANHQHPFGSVHTMPLHFEWWPLLLLLVAALAWIIGRRVLRRRPLAVAVDAGATAPAGLAEAIDDSLDDLLAEPDPRRAIVAAYARLESALGRAGLGRRPGETARELLARLLATLPHGNSGIDELTALFEEARFSTHTIGEADRQRAIALLRAVRDNQLVDARA